MWDELDQPLGFVSGAAAAPPARRMRLTGRAATGAAVLAIAIGLVMFPRRDSPLKGEPFALAKVEVLPAPRKAAAPDTTASVREAVAPPIASAEQVEAASGVKITRGGASPPKAVIIDVARALRARLAPAPDARIVEKPKDGPPAGADGPRPLEGYAKPVVSAPNLSASP